MPSGRCERSYSFGALARFVSSMVQSRWMDEVQHDLANTLLHARLAIASVGSAADRHNSPDESKSNCPIWFMHYVYLWLPFSGASASVMSKTA